MKTKSAVFMSKLMNENKDQLMLDSLPSILDNLAYRLESIEAKELDKLDNLARRLKR